MRATIVLLSFLLCTAVLAKSPRDVLISAREGRSVTIAFIGGSITQGAWATTAEQRYVDRLAAWWRSKFRGALRVVNAGIGGTASDYGALRLKRDVLDHKPDLVIVEYGVNDAGSSSAPVSYRSLLTQALDADVAVVALELGNAEGTSAQSIHAPIAASLGVPVVSVRDIIAARGSEGLFSDPVHPNDAGHALIASTLTAWLEGLIAPD